MAPAAAEVSERVALTYEQTEDRSNFISQVRKARQGDTESQWQVGLTYVTLGDVTRAMPMIRSAAEAGHARAAALLGLLTEQGRGTAKSIEDAKHWYRLAADQGDTDGMAALGRILLSENQPEGRAVAGQLLLKAAESGNASGQYHLGWMLAARTGSEPDDRRAYDWFVAAARQGHPGAQLAAAQHLLTGRGVARDGKAAGQWLIEAATTQDPVAHYMLGRWRQDASDGNGNLELAQRSFRIAAFAGHREAQFALATLLTKDREQAANKEAVEWYAKAHEAGHKAAANRLGEMYRDGKGVSRQLDRARNLFQQAADHGDVNAMYNVAQMQSDGLGGARDTENALRWYVRAADAGHELASEAVSRLLDSSVKTSSLGLKGFWQ